MNMELISIGLNNWKKVRWQDHLNHCAAHLLGEGGIIDLTQQGTKPLTEKVLEEASHALCRAQMMLEMMIEEFRNPNVS